MSAPPSSRAGVPLGVHARHLLCTTQSSGGSALSYVIRCWRRPNFIQVNREALYGVDSPVDLLQHHVHLIHRMIACKKYNSYVGEVVRAANQLGTGHTPGYTPIWLYTYQIL